MAFTVSHFTSLSCPTVLKYSFNTLLSDCENAGTINSVTSKKEIILFIFALIDFGQRYDQWLTNADNTAEFPDIYYHNAMKITISIAFALCALICSDSLAQTYAEQIAEYRIAYKQGFLEDVNSPLRKRDLKYLDFFEPDSTFVITATFRRTADALPFDMPTSSGKMKQYVKFGEAQFRLHDRDFTINVYQSVQLREMEQYKNYLFIPFNDASNGSTTYGGGRYLDIDMDQIVGDKLIIDFNKAYNPYCVYADGYSCPVPPRENYLDIEINAGEKNFLKKH